jgi:hypothetical protein
MFAFIFAAADRVRSAFYPKAVAHPPLERQKEVARAVALATADGTVI